MSRISTHELFVVGSFRKSGRHLFSAGLDSRLEESELEGSELHKQLVMKRSLLLKKRRLLRKKRMATHNRTRVRSKDMFAPDLASMRQGHGDHGHGDQGQGVQGHGNHGHGNQGHGNQGQQRRHVLGHSKSQMLRSLPFYRIDALVFCTQHFSFPTKPHLQGKLWTGWMNSRNHLRRLNVIVILIIKMTVYSNLSRVAFMIACPGTKGMPCLRTRKKS